MANGSFHDELLSVHETESVSLTHRMDSDRSELHPRPLGPEDLSGKRGKDKFHDVVMAAQQ